MQSKIGKGKENIAERGFDHCATLLLFHLSDNTERLEVIGSHGTELINPKGKLFADLCRRTPNLNKCNNFATQAQHGHEKPEYHGTENQTKLVPSKYLGKKPISKRRLVLSL